MNNSENNNFKLIGIVPLKGCDSKFLKNLNIGVPYLFYNNYDINVDTDKNTIKNITTKQSSVPTTMYNLHNGINVNVSAIVGANGSGKSSLIELFYYFVYAISSLPKNKLGFIKYTETLKSIKNDLMSDKAIFNSSKDQPSLLAELSTDHEIQVNLKNRTTDYYDLINKKLDETIDITEKRIEAVTDIDNLINTSLNLSVIYEVNGELIIIEYSQGDLIIKDKNGNINDEEFNFNNFFYSICLNYSHHALNSKILGEWINSLFHKNDGYKTPVVINPMRENGDYYINHELSLSKERVMFNLAYFLILSENSDNEYKLLEKYKVQEISFSIKPSSRPHPINYDDDDFHTIPGYFLIKDFISSRNQYEIKHLDIAIGYLERKLKKIERNYKDIIYKNYDKELGEKIQCFQDFIKNDTSHISKKVHQIVNYLRCATNKITSEKYVIFSLDPLKSASLDSKEFVAFIHENRKTASGELEASLNVLDIVNFLPPSIFDIDFKLTINNNDTILLNELSSGEQQMIFNTNTVLYHLYNLQSTFSDKDNRLVYENISIVLDEIELYYHPDMQRQFIKNLLDSLELVKSKNNDGIKSINIQFLTHSPFILSDIPSENILKLKEGRPILYEEETNSFASNIHTLLADSFFMQGGVIGDFSKRKINEIITLINSNKELNKEEHEYIIKLIRLIGEPLIKNKLAQMYTQNNSLNILQRLELVESKLGLK
ncbi:hypothetical protein [Myroides odoratus]|uniref:hypothetical protein n=1 Tax=Myroides odoratus TaxID=256 RepID=UPI00333E2617